MRQGNLAAVRALATLVLLLAGCALSPVPMPATSEPATRSLATTDPNATQRPAPRAAFGDGTHLVPQDVAPGTYRTIGYADECYWTRLSGFGGGLEDWVSSAIGPGYHVVTIGPDDAGFDSAGCGDWTRRLEAVTASQIAFGEGTYIVGTDVQPGNWAAESGHDCYWARLSGFGGTEAEIIDQDLTSNGLAPVVTISRSDIGFTSNGCGTWRRAAP